MTLRDLGLIACLIGVMVMAVGRFNPHVYGAVAYVGVAVIVVGWVLLALSAWKRQRIPPSPSSRTERKEL